MAVGAPPSAIAGVPSVPVASMTELPVARILSVLEVLFAAVWHVASTPIRILFPPVVRVFPTLTPKTVLDDPVVRAPRTP